MVVLSLSLVPACSTVTQTGSNEDIFAAVKSGNVQEVTRLLAAGADSNGRDHHRDTPLKWAALSGLKEIAELLIERGADLNATDQAGFTPLHAAAYQSRREVAELLVRRGAEVNAKSTAGWTPLHKAIERLANPEVTQQTSPSDVAAMMGVVELLLANGAEVNARNTSDTTPLHNAAASGPKALVELLIAKGADIHTKTNEGVTPLYIAAKMDRAEVAEFLIARGAEVDARTKESGYTPLIRAAHQGNRDVVELLIVRGADVNAKDINGKTPLNWALTTALSVSPSGQALLRQLSAAKRRDLQKEIQKMKGQWREVAKLLINRGANTNADSQRGPPLYLAANMGDKDLVEALIDHGAEINYAPPCCESALHAAIAERHRDVAEFLIKKGASVNARNRSERTPLHFLAVFINDRKLAELMIERGADINAKDKNGQTPIDLATNAGNNQVAEVLRRKAGI